MTTPSEIVEGTIDHRPPSRWSAFWAAAAFQLSVVRREPWPLPIITAPIIAVSLLAVVSYSGREDLAAYAVIAPAVMAILGMAVSEAGEVISQDRQNGVLEAILTTPVPLGRVLLARIGVITVVSLVAIVECWLVAAIFFQQMVTVDHPVIFGATLVALAMGIAAIGVVMAAVFVVGRSVRAFQNSLSFPLFLLGGVMVPAGFLPGFLQPISQVFFLSWATDLLRDSMQPASVENAWGRLGMILFLSALTYAIGTWLLHRLIRRIRHTGQVNFA